MQTVNCQCLQAAYIIAMEGIEFSGIDSRAIGMDSDNDTSTFGIAFNPRKTRSGKVVGYRDEK